MDTSLSARGFAKARLHEAFSEAGVIITADGTTGPYRFEETHLPADEAEGSVLVHGPAYPGTRLIDIVESHDVVAAWEALHRLLSLVFRAAVSAGERERLAALAADSGPGGAIIGTDGGILLLPGTLYRRALASRPRGEELAERLSWVYPDCDKDPQRRLAFMAGALAYRIVCSKRPFAPGNEHPDLSEEESLACVIREEGFLPAELENPSLKYHAALTIDGLLRPSVATSIDTLLAFGPSYRSLIEADQSNSTRPRELADKRNKALRKISSKIKRASLSRRYRYTAIIASAAALVALALAVSWSRSAAALPSTEGLSAREVTEGYYRGLGALDQGIARSYVTRQAGREYDRLVSAVFVMSRMRQSYESRAGLVSPEELRETGDAGGMAVFGISELSVDELRLSGKEASFRSSFRLWVPSREGEADGSEWKVASGEEPLVVYERADLVTLSMGKKGWKITAIVREKSDIVARGVDEAMALTLE